MSSETIMPIECDTIDKSVWDSIIADTPQTLGTVIIVSTPSTTPNPYYSEFIDGIGATGITDETVPDFVVDQMK